VQAGGRVWLAGAGAGTASILDFNNGRNDDSEGNVYSDVEGELVPGRILYDGAHWQSSFSALKQFILFRRSRAAERIAGAPWSHADRWTGAELHAPDYRRLPAELRVRDPATDPLPPTRYPEQSQYYYRGNKWCEYLLVPNVITEDVDTTSNGVRMVSTLDTLIEVEHYLLRRSPAPTMTWYHGGQANRFVFSGFAPWDFRREDCIALTDFVLQDLWGLRRREVNRGPVPTHAGPTPPGTARSVGVRGTTRSPGGYR